MPHYSARDQHLALPRQRQAHPAASRNLSVLRLQKPAPRCLCYGHPVAQSRNQLFRHFPKTAFVTHRLTTSATASVPELLFTLPTRPLNSK